MKPSLQLKFSQQLSITPRLQQAIRLLQLSTLELQQEIQQAIENNPLLEIAEHSAVITDNGLSNETCKESGNLISQSTAENRPLESTFNNLYPAAKFTSTSSNNYYDVPSIDQNIRHPSLQDYLLWQLNLTPFNEQDRAIATVIIDAINSQGYLTISLDEILESQGNVNIERDEVVAVLKRIQQFDPIAVGARNLQECLAIQLEQYTMHMPYVRVAKIIVNQYLSLLANHDYRILKKKLNVKEQILKDAIHLIQQLNPYPGEQINTEFPSYIIPDVLVKKHSQRWYAVLNKEIIPQLQINQSYAAMEKQVNRRDGQFIRTHLQEANWFIKSIANRHETLFKVSEFIVQHQQKFFQYGEEQMQPLILADVAKAINMHESTISRITTQKYLQCSRGIFELKYFFSSRVHTDHGNDASSTAIKALIKKMISTENNKKPLSDSKIAELLEEKGMTVARRTVAKYRELLAIAPSHQRKNLD
ncbi:MAG: RNA polymerase factor sigma-54 [Candidatus Schmidhempelia sp.]|nr:RNA polymerase factor sigma-54 [Candidatus Schmidhempelia sp.]